MASLPASRGEEGRRKKLPGPRDVQPQTLRRLGGRDSRVPKISLLEVRLHLNRSSARPQLSRWPPPPRASPAPQTSCGADSRVRVKTGVRWGPGSDPLRPRVASHRPDLTLHGAVGARRLRRLGRVPPAPCVPGGSGAGRGRVRAGRGTPRLSRPLRDPPGAPPHCRWGTRAVDEPQRYSSQI